MRVVFKCVTRKQAYQWTFGSNSFQTLPDIADDTEHVAWHLNAAVSQKSGKIFTHKGKNGSYILQLWH